MRVPFFLASPALALLVLLASPPALAAPWPEPTTGAPAGLPLTDAVQTALAQEPGVARAQSALSAAGHGAAMLERSPHEWTARVSGQHRSIDGSPASREWSAQLERPFRINGKGELDKELGEVGLAYARAQLGEARHEAARDLADLWLDWQAARRSAEIAQEQLALAQANLRAVETRRRAGDASLMDQNLAQAEVIEAKRLLNSAESSLHKASAHLRLRFPTLALQAQPLQAQPLETPAPLEREEALWRERILAESDPLRTAELAVRLAELQARRAEADRLADPTVGLYTASEAAGRERIVGLSLSIPLGGSYRSLAAQSALRQADMARAELEGLRRRQEIEIADTYADAQQGHVQWQLAEASASAARENARLGQRAYTLGEGDLQALLLLRRQSLEATNAAHAAQVQALRARHRLLIDAHLIWGLAED